MKIYFGQIYSQPGVEFPFTIRFQQCLSNEVSSLVEPSSKFVQRFGKDWHLIFRISAKRLITETEIYGPSVFKKDKGVEFSLFLPFDAFQRQSQVPRAAIEHILRGACSVLTSLEFDITRLQAQVPMLAERLSSDSMMIKTQ